MASRARRLKLPLPLVFRSSPCSVAASPGAVRASLPLPPGAAGWTSSWPLSSASSVRTRNADSTSVPPACCGFQLPVALASRSVSWPKEAFCVAGVLGAAVLFVLTPALAGFPAAFTLATKFVAAPWLCAVAWPSSSTGVSCVCISAGSMRCAVARRFQAWDAVHSPLASTSPPPSCALRLRTMAAPLRHSPWVSSCSSGSRC